MFKNEDGYTTTGWDYEKDMPIFANKELNVLYASPMMQAMNKPDVEPTTTSGTEAMKRAGGIDKQTISYIVWGAGLAAGIGGIFYAHKKGYGGWGKFGMFILFSIPFNITAGVIRLSDKNN
jgi:hypothetical protein